MRGVILVNSTFNFLHNCRYNGMDVVSYVIICEANNFIFERFQILCS